MHDPRYSPSRAREHERRHDVRDRLHTASRQMPSPHYPPTHERRPVMTSPGRSREHPSHSNLPPLLPLPSHARTSSPHESRERDSRRARFPCEDCHLPCVDEETRVMHTLLHHQPLHCWCRICDCTYTRFDELFAHQHKHQDAFFEYRCNLCSWVTNSDRNLFEHALSRTCRLEPHTLTRHVTVSVRGRVYDKGVSPTPPPVQMTPDTTCPEDKPVPKVSTPVTTMATTSLLTMIHQKVVDEVRNQARPAPISPYPSRAHTQVSPAIRTRFKDDNNDLISSLKRTYGDVKPPDELAMKDAKKPRVDSTFTKSVNIGELIERSVESSMNSHDARAPEVPHQRMRMYDDASARDLMRSSIEAAFKQEAEAERAQRQLEQRRSEVAQTNGRVPGGSSRSEAGASEPPKLRPNRMKFDFADFIRSELEKNEDGAQVRRPPPPQAPADVSVARQRSAPDSHSESRDASDVTVKQPRSPNKFSPSLPPLKSISSSSDERGQSEHARDAKHVVATSQFHAKPSSAHSSPDATPSRFAAAQSDHSLERLSSCEEERQLVICESGTD